MPDQVIVREATSADRANVLALLRKNFLHHLALDPTYYHDPDAIRDRLSAHISEALVSKDPTLYVAEARDGATVGFMSCGVVKSSYFDSIFERYASIYELYIEESQRGKGIGHKLIAVAEIYARTQGCKVLHLQTSTYNAKALEFYEKCNFVDRQRHLYRTL